MIKPELIHELIFLTGFICWMYGGIQVVRFCIVSATKGLFHTLGEYVKIAEYFRNRKRSVLKARGEQ